MPKDNIPEAVYLSYCCPFEMCGAAHTVGCIDPDLMQDHIRSAHRVDLQPDVRRWDHSAMFFAAMGERGPIG